MRHPDETLHDGHVKPDTGIAKIKKKSRHVVDDRRVKASGAQALMAKVAEGKKSAAGGARKSTTTQSSAMKVIKGVPKLDIPRARADTLAGIADRIQQGSSVPSRDPAEVAAAIRLVLVALRREDVAMPHGLAERLEGALFALSALAEGRRLAPQDFFSKKRQI